jgi:RNA polymerase sigma-70 factor (ECF subfamily)
MKSDEELFVEIQRGDEAAFETLVRRFEVELFCYLARYTGDAALADDVFQNTFLQVYQKRQSFDSGRRVRPWLYAVATHQAIDALRRQQRSNRNVLDVPQGHDPDSGAVAPCDALAAPGPSVEAAAIDGEARRQVRAAVDQLPEHLKPVVIMSYFQSMRHKEIAQALSIPVGTVKSRLFAAVKLLQEKWNSQPLATGRS